ncbi:MAG TPA: type II toxin-antitoxin system VapC family toxin [Gemmatimonadaceae bacterium]|nr:type II toxin-antitoxin system VapC family toxin [Gemmatimonadaceae bacterium]
MRFLLDTCVLSDGAKPDQFGQLARWLDAQPIDDLAIGALAVGELRFGIERLPRGRKRERLKAWLDGDLLPAFAARTIAIDAAVAEAWALLCAAGDEMGRPLPVVDGLMLASAQVNGLTFVTRDISDLEGRGVSVLSPY